MNEMNTPVVSISAVEQFRVPSLRTLRLKLLVGCKQSQLHVQCMKIAVQCTFTQNVISLDHFLFCENSISFLMTDVIILHVLWDCNFAIIVYCIGKRLVDTHL